MTLTTHAVAPAPAELTDLSPLVYSRRSRSLYVAPSRGRGRHDQVYNLMQRLGVLTPAVADDAHGHYRPDGTFEWYEYFPVPDRLEEQEILEALAGRVAWPSVSRRAAVLAGRRLRPVRAQARRAGERAQDIRRRLSPPRPPSEPAERIADLSQVEPYREFVTGNGYASACRYVLNYDSLEVNEEGEGDWWFCKSDWLEHFFRDVAPDSPFVLFTANSDRPIDRRLARYLERPNLRAWFGVNVDLHHPKLHAIPLGIGDPTRVFGHAGAALRAVRQAGIEKRRLLEVSFNVNTNPRERLRCLAETGLELDPPAGGEYLERLGSSYFCVGPAGNGIDTHRVWEALYLGTIPVTTRSVLSEQHPDLPLLVLDEWSDFRSLALSPELHPQIWGDFDLAALSLSRYLERVRSVVASAT